MCYLLILEGEVERLGWKVSDDVGQVSSPECKEALFLRDSDEAVNNTWKKILHS